tara:strand:+ start:10546 stop:11070 length:525 start_codon:yes stop_codon:yes gene_type:complete
MESNNVFAPATLERTVRIPFEYVTDNMKSMLEKYIRSQYENKCNVEGYIKKDTSTIVNYSTGILNGDSIDYAVTFDCLLCIPVEGMIIKCVADNITKAGIKASISGENSPMTIFVVRDHHHMLKEFTAVQVGDAITIRVIGQRYELNDKFISVIGEYIPSKRVTKQSKLVFKDK